MIEKLNFKNAKTIRDDFGVIEDKIDEIIDVVNNLGKQELNKVIEISEDGVLTIKGKLLIQGNKEER